MARKRRIRRVKYRKNPHRRRRSRRGFRKNPVSGLLFLGILGVAGYIFYKKVIQKKLAAAKAQAQMNVAAAQKQLAARASDVEEEFAGYGSLGSLG
jgi:cell division protein FtsB